MRGCECESGAGKCRVRMCGLRVSEGESGGVSEGVSGGESDGQRGPWVLG